MPVWESCPSKHGGFCRRDLHDCVRSLVDHVPSMVAYWGADLQCKFANRAYEQWFGVDPDGLVGKSIKDLLGPDLFALNEPYIQGVLRGEKQLFERVVRGPNGIQRNSLASYTPDIIDGEVWGFIAHVTDVTKLKEAEAELRTQAAQREHAYELLRKSESALREAQRLGQIGSWEWDINSGAIHWSDEMYHILGLDASRPPPSYADNARLYTPETWAQLTATVEQTLKTGEPYMTELEYIRPDHTMGWVEARGEVARDAQGHIVKLYGTLLEITEKRRMQKERIQLEVAQAANLNKTMLLSRVSHELRTPLNGIMGYAQLNLMDPTISANQRQRSEIIQSCGKHMVELVDEVLDLSGAELGRITVQCVPVNLRYIVDNCLLYFAPMADEAKVALVNELAHDQALQVQGDPMRISQVINNLVSNAIKYNRPDGRVTLSAVTSNAHVDLRITDTGIGMSRAQLARLFTLFDRLGAEQTPVEGTGVGLALSKVLAELMHGELLVESQPGSGTTFTLRLARNA